MEEGASVEARPTGSALRIYVDVLEEIAGGAVAEFKDWAKEPGRDRAARELLRAGLISDYRVEAGIATFTQRLVLTPDGALALAEWRDYLRERNPWMRAWRVIYQWLLVLVGAIAGGASGIVATRIWPPG